MAGRVAGKVAMVTGGAMGLGKADCERLAEEGAKIVVTDIDSEKGEAVAKALGGHFFEHDVRDEARWKAILAEVEKLHGGLDILVNNAGNVIFEPIEQCSLDHFRLHLDIHVVGTFLGCKYAIPLMTGRAEKIGGGGSSIVNMASTAALMGYPVIPAYTAAKGAIASMTRSIAMHCQDESFGIRCNALAPGGIETPMVQAVSGRQGEAPMAIPDGPLPADALGAPRDVANCVLFLASDEARFLNGLVIPVDNGLDARPHH
nr:SDR family oxidoreductase [Tsuneonella mangrovi]